MSLDRVALVVDVLPFQAAAFTPANSCSDNELVVVLVLEAFILQRSDDFLHRILVCNLGTSCMIRDKTALSGPRVVNYGTPPRARTENASIGAHRRIAGIAPAVRPAALTQKASFS